MTHDEIIELLGAYSLDAVEPDEAAEVETHLATCPRCRAEVQAHRETASMLGNAGAEAPPGLWDRIAASIAEQTRPAPSDLPRLPASGPSAGPSAPHERTTPRWRRGGFIAAAAGIAAAIAAVVVLASQVADLHDQVQQLNSALARKGLSATVAGVALGPHRTVELTSATHPSAATIIVAPGGQAYWVSSSLARLSTSKTYQVWGLANGRVVSLGLVGPDPHTYAAFRVERPVSTIMVTAEPAGGVPAPTSPVLAAGSTT